MIRIRFVINIILAAASAPAWAQMPTVDPGGAVPAPPAPGGASATPGVGLMPPPEGGAAPAEGLYLGTGGEQPAYRWQGEVPAIPLGACDAITLEVGPVAQPDPYSFPRGFGCDGGGGGGTSA